MKKILTLLVVMAFIAFGFAPGAFAADEGMTTHDYYGSDQSVDQGFDTDSDQSHEYFGSDQGLKEDFDEDTGTQEYYGSDESLDHSFDADRDTDTQGYYGSDQSLNEGFDADQDMTHEYFGSDPGINEDADEDLTHEYYGSDEGINEGFDSRKDLDTGGGAGLGDMESEATVDHL